MCGLHILLGALYKRVALGRIHCFCLSQAARDVQQVQETTNSSLRVNGLQAADYLLHVTRGGLDSYPNGDTQVSTEAQGDEPGSRRPTKMTAAVKPLLLSTFRPHHDSEDSPKVSRCSGLDVQMQCLLPVDSPAE